MIVNYSCSCGNGKAYKYRAYDYDVKLKRHRVRLAQNKYVCTACRAAQFDRTQPAQRKSNSKFHLSKKERDQIKEAKEVCDVSK